MSIFLNQGTKPDGLAIKTHGIARIGIMLGDYEISMLDFLVAAEYVLTNTDLEPNDPRLQFVKCVKAMKKVEGHNKGRKHLSSALSPIPES